MVWVSLPISDNKTAIDSGPYRKKTVYSWSKNRLHKEGSDSTFGAQGRERRLGWVWLIRVLDLASEMCIYTGRV